MKNELLTPLLKGCLQWIENHIIGHEDLPLYLD